MFVAHCLTAAASVLVVCVLRAIVGRHETATKEDGVVLVLVEGCY